MLKKYWFIIFGVVSVALLLSWLSLKEKFDALKMNIKVASINIKDIHENRIQCTLAVILSNPLPVAIDIPKLEYKILVDSMLLLESLYQKPIHIEPSDSKRIILPMETTGRRLERILEIFNQQDRDSALYTLRGSFSAQLPLIGVRKFRIEEQNRMPALRIPKLEIDHVQVAKPGFHESRLQMTVHIENPGLLRLKLKNAGYTFTIDNILKLEGTPEKNIEISPKETQSIPMVLDIKTAKVVRLTWKALFQKKHTDFEMHFHGTVVSKDTRVNNSYLTIVKRGTLDELKKQDAKK